MDKRDKQTHSGWKWAFIVLLATNIIVVFYVNSLLNAIPPVKDEIAVPEAPNSEETIEALITLGNADLEDLLRYALSENTAAGVVPSITISEDVMVSGELEVLGFTAMYQMTAEPFASESGDLQLKVSKVELGRLSLPIKQVLQLLSSQMDQNLPIELDFDNALITVRLSEVETETVKRIKLEKIEKELAEYTFNITIAKENLLQ